MSSIEKTYPSFEIHDSEVARANVISSHATKQHLILDLLHEVLDEIKDKIIWLLD